VNPWRTNILESVRDAIRFGLNLFVVAAAVMSGVFATAVIYRFLTHLWGFVQRKFFSGPW